MGVGKHRGPGIDPWLGRYAVIWDPFCIDAHTKVNLALRVLRRQENGYHDLDTVFQELQWGDQLSFNPAVQFGFRMRGLVIDGGENICLRAYREFRAAYKAELPVEVILEKVVPPGSGLGGGSADAAAILKGLNRIADQPLAAETLHEIATRLGADVPFFLHGGLQRGQGIGERLAPLEGRIEGHFLLVIPPIQVSTKQAFAALRIPLTAHKEPFTFGRSLTRADMVRFFDNDFESVIFHMHPEIGEIKSTLLHEGATFASLSGSGSTVYGIFETRSDAQRVRSRFPNRYHTQITTPTH